MSSYKMKKLHKAKKGTAKKAIETVFFNDCELCAFVLIFSNLISQHNIDYVINEEGEKSMQIRYAFPRDQPN